MALKLKGSTSGFTAIDAPAVAGDNTLVLPGGNGTSGQYLQTNGSGTLSWATVSSLSNAEDGAGTDFEFNSGYGSNATAYGVRAWINFNGNAATIGTGNASANMDAVTDNGTGDYTVNFTTAMSDANYSVAGFCEYPSSAAPAGLVTAGNTYAPVAGSVRIKTVNSTSAVAIDPVYVNASFFR